MGTWKFLWMLPLKRNFTFQLNDKVPMLLLKINRNKYHQRDFFSGCVSNTECEIILVDISLNWPCYNLYGGCVFNTENEIFFFYIQGKMWLKFEEIIQNNI